MAISKLKFTHNSDQHQGLPHCPWHVDLVVGQSNWFTCPREWVQIRSQTQFKSTNGQQLTGQTDKFVCFKLFVAVPYRDSVWQSLKKKPGNRCNYWKHLGVHSPLHCTHILYSSSQSSASQDTFLHLVLEKKDKFPSFSLSQTTAFWLQSLL